MADGINITLVPKSDDFGITVKPADNFSIAVENKSSISVTITPIMVLNGGVSVDWTLDYDIFTLDNDVYTLDGSKP